MYSKIIIICLFICLCLQSFSQIENGRIVFVRKTNIKKTLGDVIPEKWKYHVDDIKVDSFMLEFNDTSAQFKSMNENTIDPIIWATNHNLIIQNKKMNKKITFITVNNQKIKIEENNDQYIKWKITGEERVICGFTCIKAFFVKEDHSKIYAWFCPYISPDFGPEGLGKLPGLILGLAVEDGSITYFASSFSDLKVSSDVSIPKYTFTFENTSDMEKYIFPFIDSPLNKKLYYDAIKWL